MKNKSLLLTIIFLACALRLFQLDTNPPSLTWDEVAWGYNAYSLGINNTDEFGRFLPFDYLESFGDFKPPVYAYLDILPIKFFGMTEFAVRFPSALFGILTVATTYFLINQLFLTSKYKEQYALITTGILAISPWHILLSRAAFEANIASFFIVFGIYTFLKGIQDKPIYLIISSVSFVISMYTFNTSRIVAPALVILLSVFFYKNLLKMKKTAIVSAVIGIILLLPLLPFFSSPQARLRYEEVNIFSNIQLVETSNLNIKNDNYAWWSKILYNRRIIYAEEYLKHYFDNLTLKFLFIKGDGNPKFSTQETGQMYLWEMPFLFIGILFLIRKKENNWLLIPMWLLIGIIPAATARETPHALRIETTLPAFQILVAYGIVNSTILLKKYRRFFIGSLAVTISLFFAYFIHVYFIQYPWRFSGDWQYGYKDSIDYVRSVQNNYDRVVMTTALGRPYIYYLFYLQFPPIEFRESAIIKRDAFGFVAVDGFFKYRFSKDIQVTSNTGKTLYITTSEEKLPPGAKQLKIFYKLDGLPVLQAFTI